MQLLRFDTPRRLSSWAVVCVLSAAVWLLAACAPGSIPQPTATSTPTVAPTPTATAALPPTAAPIASATPMPEPIAAPPTATTVPAAAPPLTATAAPPLTAISAPTTAPPSATSVPPPTRAPAKVPPPPPPPGSVPAGAIRTASFRSRALGEDLRYKIYLPAGYEHSHLRYPVVYLLHGKGGGMADWAVIAPDLDALIASRAVPPMIAVLPDAPWSNGAHYYVDSEYGSEPRGRPVETALTGDLVAHVDATYRTLATRDGRIVAGFSMGGYGALRYALAHPNLYRGAVVLSAAVFQPFPPSESGTRQFGAFGRGATLFEEGAWTARNYPTAATTFAASGLPSAIFIAVGDDETPFAKPADRQYDFDLQAHVAYNYLRRVQNLATELRVLQGGHSWDVWRPGFIEGIRFLAPLIQPPQ